MTMNQEMKKPQFLCIQIDREFKVNVRIPLELVRNGIKLAAFIPQEAAHLVTDRLRSKGIDLEIIASESFDHFIERLQKFHLGNDEHDQTVKIYCE